MKTVSKKDRLRQLGRVTTLALVAGAPLIGTIATAQAAPGDYGFRRDQQQYQGGRIRQDVTVTGVVTTDLPGDQFDVRADNGRTYHVVFHRNANEPRRLSRNDRVEVSGSQDRDVLIADDVRILDNRGGNNRNDRNDTRTLTGVVTKDFSGDNFEMRADNIGNGRTIRVDARGDEPRRLSRGDTVTVTGRFSNNDRDRFVAESVRILDNRGNNGRNDRDNITREGVVTEDMSGDRFRMRLDNGRSVVVQERRGESQRLSRGDRVTVVGRFSDNREDTFIAQSVRITRNR